MDESLKLDDDGMMVGWQEFGAMPCNCLLGATTLLLTFPVTHGLSSLDWKGNTKQR
jgi:hypothetical protein